MNIEYLQSAFRKFKGRKLIYEVYSVIYTRFIEMNVTVSIVSTMDKTELRQTAVTLI